MRMITQAEVPLRQAVRLKNPGKTRKPCTILLLMVVGSAILSDRSVRAADWRPSEGEREVTGNSCWEAIRVYREASVAMRVHEYLNSRHRTPGEA